MVEDKEIYCKNCTHHWKLSDGGKDPYVCHKCGYNNKDMKLTEIMKELGLSNLEEKKEKPNLWSNIRAQRARGEKPARKGSKAFKQAVKAAKKINKATKK